MTDEFDFREEQPKKKFKFGSAVWNLASLLAVLATLCIGAFFVLIFLNPQSGLNPLPPAPVEQPTSTLEATATSELTASPSPTTQVPTPTLDVPGGTFELQEGSPAALDASVFHPELGCNFLGVAGQVFGLDGAPLDGVSLMISGTLSGEEINKLGLTGAATSYGEGSYYEIQLGDAPVISEGTLHIVVLDENDLPASDPVSFNTTESCQQNLILINFNERP